MILLNEPCYWEEHFRIESFLSVLIFVYKCTINVLYSFICVKEWFKNIQNTNIHIVAVLPKLLMSKLSYRRLLRRSKHLLFNIILLKLLEDVFSGYSSNMLKYDHISAHFKEWTIIESGILLSFYHQLCF